MKIRWIVEKKDITNIKNFINYHLSSSFVKKRIQNNIEQVVNEFDKKKFWYILIACLLTTQQRSGPDSQVSKFLFQKPFPLTLGNCRKSKKLNAFVENNISKFGGLRRAKKIGKEVETNYEWLESGGWDKVKNVAQELIIHKSSKDKDKVKGIERNAAYLVMNNLNGFGPKQSRNLWQGLGLTRYEIPIDSRITKWLNKFNFPVKLTAGGLSDSNYYDFVMTGIQVLCDSCKIYPCVLDAVIFSSYDKEWPEDKMLF